MRDPFIAAVDRWHEDLVKLGFTDDGDRLIGPVPWRNPITGQTEIARVVITPTSVFPYKPPVVFVSGLPFEVTFHANADGTLCLWTDEWPVEEAPWLTAGALRKRIAGWLESSAAGWPDDDDCDLERYLPQETADTRLVLYDASILAGGPVRTAPGPNRDTILITNEERRSGDLDNRRRLRRKDRNLAWVADLGDVKRPFRCWDDVAAMLGARAGEISRLIALGAVKYLILVYMRGDIQSTLVTRVRPSRSGVWMTACESADISTATRMMRAGPAASTLANTRIAVIGCGAVGSFAADLLFRAGARRLTLVDGERLRPGNVVRHLAGSSHVGWFKNQAVRACLSAVEPDIAGVLAPGGKLGDLDCAGDLVRDHQVVLDATGSGFASSLLAVAADTVGRATGHAVVSVCVQRDGEIVRVDRMPLRNVERALPALPSLDSGVRLRERGCGSDVSPTPPGAVVAAAELAHRVVIDAATLECEMPPSVVLVRHPQLEPAYSQVGMVTSETLSGTAP